MPCDDPALGGAAPEALRRKERAIDEAPVGAVITDPDREDNPIVYANRAFERITGYPTDEIVGLNCRFLQGPDTDPETVDELREAIDAEEQVTVEIMNYRRDGEPFWNEVTVAPIHDGDGELVNYVGFQRDVTRRREAETALREERELLALVNQIVRHDIRNDMSIVAGWLDLIADDVSADNRDALEHVRDATEHVIDLTETLGELVDTIEDDGPELGAVDLDGVLRRAIDSIAERGDSRAGSVEIEGPGAVDVEVLADDLLGSVFSNLLSNAVFHNDAATPRIDVSVEPDDDHVTVRVADNGPGIPDDRKAEVLGRGEKGLESSGTGLGLYLVDTLVDRYGGDVRLRDNDPEGTIVEVELRRA